MLFTKQDLKISAIASKDDTRPVLTGVLFTAEKQVDTNGGAFNSDGGYKIKMVTTDSYRLVEKIFYTADLPGFERLLIPAKKLADVAKLMSNTDRMAIHEGKFIVYDHLDNIKTELAIGDPVEGTYPDYEKILPIAEPIATVTLNARYLADLMAQSDSGIVELEIRADKFAPVIMHSDRSGGGKIKSLLMPLKK